MLNRIFFLFLILLLPAGCQKASNSLSAKRIATTNTYLESAAVDLLGHDVQIVRLAQPGMCPGSFDVRPSQATEVQKCRALLRFDFQKSLDAKIRLSGTNSCQIVAVSIPGGLCEPESYLGACRQLANAFVSLGWLAPDNANAKLNLICERLKGKEAWAKHQMDQAKLNGSPVVASAHQKAFCEWLGLKVVATFRAADLAGVGEIERAIAAGELSSAKLLIANLPEGRRTADALAERLSAKVVVFENFPALKQGNVSFDEMFTSNVEKLLKTVSL